MKDHRFIELLNLYIDRQISAAETAELEAELQQDPKRQLVYRQYCQIHTATKLVYDSFRVAAPQEAAGTNRPASVELFENRRRRSHWRLYIGGLSAAACLGVVFVRLMLPGASVASGPAHGPKVAATVPPSATAPATAAAPTTSPASAISLRSATAEEYSSMLAALREQDEARLVATDRWAPAASASLFNDDVFAAKPAPQTENAAAKGHQGTSQPAEFTAFQFQR